MAAPPRSASSLCGWRRPGSGRRCEHAGSPCAQPHEGNRRPVPRRCSSRCGWF